MSWGASGRAQRWARARRRDERGSMSLSLVVLFPAVLLLIFGTVQAALWFNARSIALGAAQQGLAAARAEGGSAGAGRVQAAAFVNQAGGGEVLGGAATSVSRTAAQVRVTVTGRPKSVLPGVANLPVSQSAAGAVERFTAPGTP